MYGEYKDNADISGCFVTFPLPSIHRCLIPYTVHLSSMCVYKNRNKSFVVMLRCLLTYVTIWRHYFVNYLIIQEYEKGKIGKEFHRLTITAVLTQTQPQPSKTSLEQQAITSIESIEKSILLTNTISLKVSDHVHVQQRKWNSLNCKESCSQAVALNYHLPSPSTINKMLHIKIITVYVDVAVTIWVPMVVVDCHHLMIQRRR